MVSWRGVLFDANLLSLLEAMDSGRHDVRAGGETAGDPDASFVFGEADLLRRNPAARSVDDPDESLGAFLEDCGGGHAENRVGTVDQCRRDRASESETLRRIIQGD